MKKQQKRTEQEEKKTGEWNSSIYTESEIIDRNPPFPKQKKVRLYPDTQKQASEHETSLECAPRL